MRLKATPRIFRSLAIIATGLNIAFWSYFSVARYYAMDYHVLDLGLAANLISSATPSAWTAQLVIRNLTNQGIILFLFPLDYLNLIPAMLVFQAFMIGLPAYILYDIAYHELKKPSISLFISVAYVLYFPLSGAYWLDFHFQNLFLTLFLLGYLLLIKRHFVSASFFFILSGFVRFPYMGLVVLSMFGLLLSNLTAKRKLQRKSFDSEMIFLSAALIISLAILFFQYLYVQTPTTVASELRISRNFDPLINLHLKILTLLVIFGPLMFLPLLSKRWLLPMLPFFFVLFFANTPIFEYPEILFDQYSISVTAFVFLGLIDILNRISNTSKTGTSGVKRTNSYIASFRRIDPGKLVIPIVMILLVSSFFMQPYGPMNSISVNDYNLSSNTVSNVTLFNDVKTLSSFIPVNQKYVLVQNDLVQFFPRSSLKYILVPPFDVGMNLTKQEIADNRFPLGTSNSTFTQIDYALANINDLNSLTLLPNVNGFPTMLTMLQDLMESKYYGVLGEMSGVVLIERGYSGPLKVFDPFSTFTPLKKAVTEFQPTTEVIVQSSTLESNLSMWGGTQVLDLCPGNYEISISYNLYETSPSNVTIRAFYYNSLDQATYAGSNITFTQSSPVNSTQLSLLDFSSGNFVKNMYFSISCNSNSFSLSPSSLSIKQI